MSSAQIEAPASQLPAEAQASEGLALGLLAEWLNLELGIEKGLVTSERVAAWLANRTEGQRRDLRQALAWWMERRVVQ